MSAPNAPFFMFFKFSKPSPVAKAKNAANVKYISQRPGVDKEEEGLSPDGEAHLHYLDQRPRSHGLFGQELVGADLADVMQEIKQHDGIVWRGILSLREDDAAKYGYTHRGKWEETLRNTMPDLGHKMGVKVENFRWFAAFHKEAGHPHVHLIFWDSSSERQRGRLSAEEMRYARGLFIREIYGEERRRLLEEKTAIRNLTRQAVTGDTQDLLRMPNTDERDTLQNELVRLSFTLPSKGKAALAFMPPAVKEDARRIAAWILSREGYAAQVARYVEIAGELAKHHTRKPEQLEEAKQNAFDDLRDRVAQVVLKAAARCRQAQLSRVRGIGSTMFVFPQVWTLLGREHRRLQCEGAWLDIKNRPKREGHEHVEVDRQKEVERA